MESNCCCLFCHWYQFYKQNHQNFWLLLFLFNLMTANILQDIFKYTHVVHKAQRCSEHVYHPFQPKPVRVSGSEQAVTRWATSRTLFTLRNCYWETGRPELASAARYEISVKGLGSWSTLDSGPHSDGSGLQVQKLLQEESDQTFHNKIHADLILRGKVSVKSRLSFLLLLLLFWHNSHSWCVWFNEAVPSQWFHSDLWWHCGKLYKIKCQKSHLTLCPLHSL